MRQIIARKLTIIILGIAIFFSGTVNAENWVPEEVMLAAEDGIRRMVPLLKMQNIVPTDVALRNASLGKGFRIHTIDPEKLLSQVTPNMDELVIPMDMWRFLVESNGRPIALLTVAKIENRWEPVEIGAEDLACELKEAFNRIGTQANVQPQFVRVYQAVSDFIKVPSPMRGENSRYIPLLAARTALQFIETSKINSNRIMEEGFSSQKTADLMKQVVMDHLIDDQNNHLTVENAPE